MGNVYMLGPQRQKFWNYSIRPSLNLPFLSIFLDKFLFNIKTRNFIMLNEWVTYIHQIKLHINNDKTIYGEKILFINHNKISLSKFIY